MSNPTKDLLIFHLTKIHIGYFGKIRFRDYHKWFSDFLNIPKFRICRNFADMLGFEKANPEHNGEIYYMVIHTVYYPFEIIDIDDDFIYVPVKGEDVIMKLKIHEYSSEFDYYWVKYDY